MPFSNPLSVFTSLLICLASTSAMISLSFHRRDLCQPLEISVCRKLGYNKTRIPTDMYPSMPFQEVKKYIEMLDSIKCSPDVLFFLCNMYSPVCFAGYVPRVLPCRSVCENVKKGCLPFVKIAGFTWPSELDCQRLPDYNTGVCIRPSAIVSRAGNRHKKNLPEEKVVKCKKCTVLHQLKRYKKFKKAAYVIQAEVKSRVTTADKETKLVVYISRIYKQGKVKINRGIMEIWSPTRCVCPIIEFDKKYVIIGQEDRLNKRLVYDKRSIIAKCTTALERKLQKWSNKYKRMLARKSRRKSQI